MDQHSISYCPTGEVTLDKYVHWKSMPEIIASIGSGFVSEDLPTAGDWEAVRARLRLLHRLSAEARGGRSS
jgi:2-keto-3-deoxy-6-phosphogluconate aldolase